MDEPNEIIFEALEKYGMEWWQLADLLGMPRDVLFERLVYHELPELDQNIIACHIAEAAQLMRKEQELQEGAVV